jgi:hypothetical protein
MLKTHDPRDLPGANARTVTCPPCEGTGRVRVNITHDPTTDAWDYDEADCVACDRTGELPALVHYTVTRLPSTGVEQWRCAGCSCHVDPRRHLPFSEDCREAADERDRSRSDRVDPWAVS